LNIYTHIFEDLEMADGSDLAHPCVNDNNTVKEHILVREHILAREHILVREHILAREHILITVNDNNILRRVRRRRSGW
jgi:hypothetical protein